jgi:hypothetical protein
VKADSSYSISLVSPDELSGVEVAMHVLAQTTRFVVRKQMTAHEAAKISIEIATAFIEEMSALPDAEATK